MKIFRIFLPIILVFYGCLKENKIILKQDFEDEKDGWSEVNILKGNAHSSNSFTRTDSLHPFSACFCKSTKDLTIHKIKRIDLVTWIRKINLSASGGLILSLDKNGTPVFWRQQLTDDSSTKLNEWTRIYASYDLPDSIGENEVLKVYFLNNTKYPIDADDFEIRLFY